LQVNVKLFLRENRLGAGEKKGGGKRRLEKKETIVDRDVVKD
jgi:hypothetical protein